MWLSCVAQNHGRTSWRVTAARGCSAFHCTTTKLTIAMATWTTTNAAIDPWLRSAHDLLGRLYCHRTLLSFHKGMRLMFSELIPNDRRQTLHIIKQQGVAVRCTCAKLCDKPAEVRSIGANARTALGKSSKLLPAAGNVLHVSELTLQHFAEVCES